MKLQTLTEKFLLSYKGVYSPSTVKWYEDRFKHLLNEFSEREISKITIDDLRRLYVKLSEVETLYKDHPHPCRKPIKKGYSKYTLHSFARAWKRLFKWSFMEGYLDSNPAKRLNLPRLPKPDPKAIDRNDLVHLFNAAQDHSTKPIRDYALLRFLASTNARVGGTAGLKLHDLDIDERIAKVHEKGRGGEGNVRPVFFDPETAEALQKWLEKRPNSEDERVFMLSTSGIYQMIQRTAEKTEVEIESPHNPHAFRHGFAKEVLRQGANLAQVSQMMGHSTSAITVDYYGQFAVNELREFHEKYSWVPDSDDKDSDDEGN
jgi:site-specific recombinase XerD